MCIEHACRSGVDKRSNLTAAEVGANMILAPLQCGVRRDPLHPGTYRMERALLKPSSPEAKAVNHSTAATCALEGRAEARSYSHSISGLDCRPRPGGCDVGFACALGGH